MSLRSEEDIGSLELVTDGCESLCEFWESNPGPLQETEVLVLKIDTHKKFFVKQDLTV